MSSALQTLPSPHSAEVAAATRASFDEIIEIIANGRSINWAIARIRKRNTLARPSTARFWKWINKDPERQERYAAARRAGAELRIARAQDVVARAQAKVDTLEPARIAGMVSVAKLDIDLRKWEASKLLPRLYGETQRHEHSGSVSINLDTGVPMLGAVTDVAARVVSGTSNASDASNTVPDVPRIAGAPSWLDDDEPRAAPVAAPGPQVQVDWG